MKVNFRNVLALFFVFTLLVLGITVIVNRYQIYPSEKEKKMLNNFFQNQKVRSEEDIIRVQNIVVTEISHENTGTDQLDIAKTFRLKKGQCFDRSLLLQKYFILNSFKVRPVYLFWGANDTSILDFFKRHVNSHNVFEIYYDSQWYLIRTNHKMNRLENLNHYLNSGAVVPLHTRYIRYLNNRNGKFLYPSFLPDIYFF